MVDMSCISVISIRKDELCHGWRVFCCGGWVFHAENPGPAAQGRTRASKSVEQQQEEFASNKGKGNLPLSSQQIAAEQERNGIELSRQHILQQLQVACNPRHREMLEAALAELDRKLDRKLGKQ